MRPACRRRWALAACLLALPAWQAAHADGMPEPEVALPVVPVTVDPRGRRSPASSDPLSAGVIIVAPGETKALVVSAGNVNRIVTPFSQPDIVTTAPDQFTVRQNVVYAAPAAGDPLTLYITEKGDELTAISLVLVPQVKVAAREFRLALAGRSGRPQLTGSVQKAAAWEQDQPYEAMLADLMARLAAGGVPQGYDLSTWVDPTATPRCAATAPFRVDFSRGQQLTGGQLEAWVGTVGNAGSAAAELAETACATTPEVVAVAVWPSPRLQPGELAEIYVVRRLPPPEERGLPRPSLIEVRHAGP